MLPLALANWSRRPAAFRVLREHVGRGGERLAVMSYAPPVDDAEAWVRLRELWLDLPVHPHVLDAIERDGEGLLLRYAALDWQCAHLARNFLQGKLATIGLAIARTYETLLQHVSASQLGWLSAPQTVLDLEGEVRLAFAPASRDGLPDDMRESWPACDERGLMFVIGRELEALVGQFAGGRWLGLHDVEVVCRRCTSRLPAKRYESIDWLCDALIVAGGRLSPRVGRRADAWNIVEAGLAQAALATHGQLDLCTSQLDYHVRPDAMKLRLGTGPMVTVWTAKDVRNALLARLRRHDAMMLRDAPSTVAFRPTPWLDVEARVRALERERRFTEAIQVFSTVLDEDHTPEVCAMRARCHLELGEASHAIELAQRALASEPDHPLGSLVAVRALLVLKRRDEALAIADRWATHAPIDALAHYSRGRCLFALARHADAIACFDRATSLQPGLIVALMLRLEAARELGRLKQTVGSGTRASPIPRHLAGPSNLLAAGRAGEAIAMLELLPDDLEAQLLLGACLAAERRLADAIVVYDRIAPPPNMAALVAAGFALLELDRADEALVRFDRAVALVPEDFAVLEGRARALERLGRGDEATQLRDHRHSMR